jgi:WD40 repeat protein
MKNNALILLFIFNSLVSFTQKLKLGLPKGHLNSSSILSACFSSDGKTIITSSDFNDTYCWNSETGKNYFQLIGHNSCAHESIFSNNEKYIATRSCDKKIIIWDKLTGQFLKEFVSKIPVSFFSFSQDDKFLLTSYNFNSLALWNIENGVLEAKVKLKSFWYLNPFKWNYNKVNSISSHEEWKTRYYFSPFFTSDCDEIITSNRNGVRFFNIEKRKFTKFYKGYSKIEYNSDSSVFCLYNKRHLKIIKNNTDSIISYVSNSNCSNRLFSVNGQFFITARLDTIFIWKSDEGTLVKKLKGPNSNILMAKFYGNDSRILSLHSDGTAYLWDIEKGKIIKEFPSYLEQFENKVRSNLSISQMLFHSKKIERSYGYELPWPSNVNTIQNDYIFTYTDSCFMIWSSYNGELLKIINEATARKNLVLDNSNQKLLSFSLDSNSINVFDLVNPSLDHSLKPHEGKLRNARFLNLDGKSYILTTTGKDKIVLLDNLTGKVSNKFDLKNVYKIDYENDLFLGLSPNELGIWSLDSLKKITTKLYKRQIRGAGIQNGKVWLSKGKLTRTWKIKNSRLQLAGLHMEMDLLRSIIWAYGHPFEFFRMSNPTDFLVEEKKIRISSTMVYSRIKTFRHREVSHVDVSNNNKLLVTASADKTAKIWRMNGRYVVTLRGHNLGLISAKFSSDSKFVFTSSLDQTVRLWDVKTGNSKKVFNCTSPVIDIDVNLEMTFLLVSYDDGSIGIWDIVNEKEVIRSYFFDGDPKKWVHIHPSGLFDASPEAMEMMYWTKGIEVIEFSQLKDRYWLPGLWAKVMSGQELPKVSDMQELKLYPEVEIKSIDEELVTINLTKREGGYGAVKILLNGKEISQDARGKEFDPNKDYQSLKIDVKNHPFLKDGENTISVIASSENGINSRGVMGTIIRSSKKTKEPHFFAVIVGISNYANEQINLKYPVADANAISKAISLGANNLFKDRSHIYNLTSDNYKKPTKENIKTIFDEIAQQASSEDIMFLYLAGHGITTRGENGDFYYLTADATSANQEAYRDEQIRELTAISTNEWVDWLKQIPALKQVMILDACGSGKVVDKLISMREIEPSQIKAIDRMKDRTGMFIISGCAADAVSYEASQYGQGLLTYALLQGIKGAALKENKYIDVSTILNHARESVPNLAYGIGGIQTPQLLQPKGGSFDIGILSEEDKKNIILSEPKQVFIRSILVDKKKYRDVLEISKRLNEELNSLSSRGNKTEIVFFDSEDYSNSCQVTGGYSQTDNEITLEMTIACKNKETQFVLNAKNVDELIDKIIEKLGVK